jgi:Na+-driven multidrug efflux pump
MSETTQVISAPLTTGSAETQDLELSDTPENPEVDREVDRRLGASPPLLTLLSLVAGPFCSQVTSACYGLVDSMWISHSIGEIGLTVTSTAFVVDYIGLAFGYFISVAASTGTSFSYGNARASEVPRMISDLIWSGLIISIAVPAVLIPVAKSLMRWLSNGSEEIVHQAFLYLLPTLAGAITAVMFLLGCGILQGQGRTWHFAAAEIGSLILNGLVFDPLFLLGFKTEVWGGGLATMLAELVPGVVLMYYVLSGRSGPRFDIHLFFQKFSPESYAALRAAFASLIMHLQGVQ